MRSSWLILVFGSWFFIKENLKVLLRNMVWCLVEFWMLIIIEVEFERGGVFLLVVVIVIWIGFFVWLSCFFIYNNFFEEILKNFFLFFCGVIKYVSILLLLVFGLKVIIGRKRLFIGKLRGMLIIGEDDKNFGGWLFLMFIVNIKVVWSGGDFWLDVNICSI